jgi:hypothetical protein
MIGGMGLFATAATAPGPQTALRTRQVLLPPKPKELDSAVSTA